MSRRLLAYVAGPISSGDLTENIRRAHDAGVRLMKAGLSVIVPHGTCFWGSLVQPTVGGQPPAGTDRGFVPEVLPSGTKQEDWYGMDLPIVERCDCVLRLPGESTGADTETAHAAKHNVPVFHSVGALLTWADWESGVAVTEDGGEA
jgi:hypothetical protein